MAGHGGGGALSVRVRRPASQVESRVLTRFGGED